MIVFGQIATLGVVVLGIVLFGRFPAHRVIIGVYVFGTLFLPEFGAAESIEGVPPPLSFAGLKLTKQNAIALGLLLGSLIYDWARWFAARPHWFDLPMLAWCVGPVVSSVVNSVFFDDPVSRYVPTSTSFLGGAISFLDSSDFYDGAVRSIGVVFTWGVPYALGRLYLTGAAELRELVCGIVAGAVVYVPFCLLETLISPQLHRWVYGFHQHEFLQSMRFDGYRPMVFLEHGLAVGFWMVAATVAAAWLWFVGPLRKIVTPSGNRKINGLWVVIPLAITTVACKSTGALFLGVLGFGVLALGRAVRLPIPVLIFLCAAPLYVTTRIEESWSGEEVVELTSELVGADRAGSFEFRLRNEAMLITKARERMLVGWGGWGRWRVYDQYDRAISVADGLWVITLGERGIFGLVTLGLFLLLPVGRLLRHGSRPWTDPASATAAVAAVILGMYSLDCLMNAMVNPVYFLLAGSLIALPTVAATPPKPAVTPEKPSWRVCSPRTPSRIASLPPPRKARIKNPKR